MRGARVVGFIRTNVVKMAISHIHGRMVHDICGVANLATDDPCAKRVPARFAIRPDEFDEKLRAEYAANTHLRASAAQAALGMLENGAADTRGRPHWVTYEGMQLDKVGELTALFRALRLAEPARVWIAPPTYTKTTKDDLRDVILNFDELVAHLNATMPPASAPCLVEMLLETTPKVYEWCANPWADDAAFLADQARLAFLLLLLLITIILIILIILILRLIILLRLQAVLPAPLTPLLSR